MGNELLGADIPTGEMNWGVRKTGHKPSKTVPVGRGNLGEMGRKLWGRSAQLHSLPLLLFPK